MSKSIGYMMVSTLAFVLMKVFVKLLAHLPISEIIVARSIISFLFCYIALRRARMYPFPRKKVALWLYIRAGCGCVALWLYFYLITRIPLASVYAIQYLSPIFMCVLGGWWLKERVAPIQWLFFGIAFIGILMIQGFDTRIGGLNMGIGLVATLLVACSFLIIRHVRFRTHPLVVLMVFPLVAIPVFLPMALVQWVMPIGVEWIYLFIVGILTHTAQYCVIQATFLAKHLSKVSFVSYFGIIYALLLGFFLFNETFGWESYVGMGIVCVGVGWNASYRYRVSKDA